MAIPRDPVIMPVSGYTVASPASPHGTHTFRHASNFDQIIAGIIDLVKDHPEHLGGIQYIKEWWEDPAIVGETEEFPCIYLLPLYLAEKKTDDDNTYSSLPFIGDPLSRTTFPLTIMGYYKYSDIRHPITDVRTYAWNFWDILSQDFREYLKPGGLQAMTPHIGWHISGTNYVILWWSLQLKMQAFL